MQCKRCNSDHSGTFGSGVFCSRACANARIHSPATKIKQSVASRKNWEVMSAVERKSYANERRSGFTPEFYAERSRIGKIKRAARISTAPFSELSSPERKLRVLEEQQKRCAMCPLTMEWNGKPLSFDLDHIDGDRSNNKRENLRCVCPNCHSQTPTYKGKNSSGKQRTDEEVILALENSNSVYSALSSLGMNLHGGNYIRVRNIIKKYGLKLPYLAL